MQLSEEMHSDFVALLEELTSQVQQMHPKNSFQQLFWEQQIKACKSNDHRQMRWHPAMIRWSLYMKSKSTTGYNALRKVIALPSGRTLRDYTHLYQPKIGFQKGVDQQLFDEFKVDDIADWQRHIGIVLDEMKVKEGIVYNKNCCKILGYINLGEVTNQLLEFEQKCSEDGQSRYIPSVAKYICCFMVRGI